jgi:hypothetical protein
MTKGGPGELARLDSEINQLRVRLHTLEASRNRYMQAMWQEHMRQRNNELARSLPSDGL